MSKGGKAKAETKSGRPVVAVVGRPNVGKSTLVNRIVGRRETIVEESPGVTRDRKALDAEWAGREFTLVDTGGWQIGGLSLDKLVSAQAERAVREADVVIFVVDVTVGPTAEDTEVGRLLVRTGRPVVLAVNKVDNEARQADIWEFMALGFTAPWPVSALHGRGTGDLLDAVVDQLPPASGGDETGRVRTGHDGAVATDEGPGAGGDVGGDGHNDEDRNADEDSGPDRDGHGFGDGARPISVAIVGRPNVGKSTLFNRLIGDDRAIVHDMPGTTRDTIDTLVETEDGPVRFIDTAGMRRHAREAEGAEYYSMVRALKAIDQATLALLVIDAGAGVSRQDQRLAERVDAAGNPIVVVLNKWDLLDNEAKERVRAQVADMLGFISYAPAMEISAKTGRGAHRLYPALVNAVEAYRKRVPTASLNRALAAAQAAQPAPHGARVLYATQGATDPPTFTLFTSKQLPPSYLRYLERSIREHFGFGPTPLKLRARRRAS
ncbi:MAG: ribosome biogenesis GTPase Der [Acidimicrobiales bacterium]